MRNVAISGILHAHVAFDWGDEIKFEQARRLVPAEAHDLPRRRRTPVSISYRPLPLRFHLEPVQFSLPEIGDVRMAAQATVFDFGGVSIAMHVPFELEPERLSRLAGWLAAPASVVAAARQALQPLYRKLLPSIEDAHWEEDLSEEYFIFQIPPGAPLPPPGELLAEHSDWLASLLRLEAAPLSRQEINEAVRLTLSYSPDDLFIPDWAAAFLLDRDCEETLQAIEFANLQLLEHRHIDSRLDESLLTAYGTLHPLTRSSLPFWRSHARALRELGDLKLEASVLFERTGNVLKLVGDPYLARVFRLLAQRFYREEWRQSILRNLEVVEGAYQVVSDQTAAYRTELLEVIVVILIFVEIVLAIWRGHG